MSPEGDHQEYADHALPQSEQQTPEQNDNMELNTLETLARYLQNSQPLHVDPTFAARLEQRLQDRNRALRLEQPEEHAQSQLLHTKQRQRQQNKRSLRAYLALTAAVVCALLLSSAGTLFAASRINDPSSPLYAVRHWEQEMQQKLSATPQDRARIMLQIVDDQINALSYYAGRGLYKQALDELKEDFSSTTQAIQALPADQEYNQFAQNLIQCQVSARHTLRDLLPQLALPDQLTTTIELSSLGDVVPEVDSAEIDLPASSQGTATLLISGSNLTQGARLLLDHQITAATGTLHANALVFTLAWQGRRHPGSLGILNPDSTGAETTTITVVTTQKNSQVTGSSPNKSNQDNDDVATTNKDKANGKDKNKEKNK